MYLELLELYLSVMNHLSAIVALSRSGWIGRLVRTAQGRLLRLRDCAVHHVFDYNNEWLSRFWLNDSYAALLRRG